MSPPDPRADPTADWIEAVRAKFPVEPFLDRAFTRKLEIRAAGRYVPLDLTTAEAQLTAFLAARLDGPFELDGLRALTGGTSKEQFAFTLRHAGGERRLVLRMQPAQSIVETHRLREAQMLAAVGSVVPVPELFGVDADARFFQQPALIYGFCTGIARPPESDTMGSVRAGFGPKWRSILAPQFIDMLALIGTLDVSGQDLSAFDIPAAGTSDGVINGVNMWMRAWEEDRLEAVPLITLAGKWLRDNAPVIDHVSIVHCDYRPGNFLFDPDDGHITAVLDWELARFGDRHEDLATILMPGLGEIDENGDFLVCGLCPRDDFMSRYADKTGLPVDERRLAYYEVYNHFRVVCMSLGSAGRCIAAQKTHQDIILSIPLAIAGMALGELQSALAKVHAHGA